MDAITILTGGAFDEALRYLYVLSLHDGAVLLLAAGAAGAASAATLPGLVARLRRRRRLTGAQAA